MSTLAETAPNEALLADICRRIETKGGITFAEYMETCLSPPPPGYYLTPRVRVGKEGDFFTSSSVHSLFGRLIGRQLRQMWELLGGGAFTVVEQGAGEGHLCLDILDAAAQESPDFYGSLHYQLVDISPDHRQRQRQLLARHEDKVSWHRLDEISGVTGCFLSNELVDAFPVHLVEKSQGDLREVYVTSGQDGFAEELRPLSTSALAGYFSDLGIDLAEENRAEISLAASAWMADVAERLARGFVLTIDYGYLAEELFAPYRRAGTLMCYRRHVASEDPYSHVGEQDITSHVDFTMLQQVGARGGLLPLWYGPQYRFLMGLGFVEELTAMEAREEDERKARALRLTLKNLILPEGGMGETFKVLIQGKGVGKPGLLCNRPIGSLGLPVR